MAMHNGGKLVPLLTEAGAIASAGAKATATPSL
jgi:glutaredoxin 3